MIGILHLLTSWLPDPPGAGSQRPADQQCKNRLLRLARVFPALQVIKLVPLVIVDGDVIIIIITMLMTNMLMMMVMFCLAGFSTKLDLSHIHVVLKYLISDSDWNGMISYSALTWQGAC